MRRHLSCIVGLILALMPIASAGQSVASQPAFVGSWKSQQQSNGITSAMIVEQDGGLKVHLWGACRPADCDWGVVKFARLPNAAPTKPEHGFADYHEIGKYVGFHIDGSDLVIEVYGVPEKQSANGAPRFVFVETRLQRVH